MPLDEEYMEASLSFLADIEAHAANANQRLQRMEDMMLEMGAIAEQMMEGGGGAKIEGSMNKLTGKIDELIAAIEESGTGAGGGGTEVIEGGSLKGLAEGVSSLLTSIAKAPLGKVEAKVPTINAIIRDIVKGITEGIDEETAAKAEQVANTIATLSGGIVGFGAELAKAVPLYAIVRPMVKPIANTIGTFIDTIGKAVDTADVEDAEETAGILSTFAGSSLKFAGMMAGATPLLAIAAPGVFIMAGLIPILATGLQTLGAARRLFIRGANTLARVGFSILLFAGGMAAATALLAGVGIMGIGDLAFLFTSIGLSAGAFALVGKFEDRINRGSLAVLLMSASLGIFALSMGFASGMIPPLSETLMMAGSLAAIGLTFMLAGRLFKNIALGAVAFAAIGASLFLISFPLETIAGVVTEHPEVIGTIPALLVSLGLSFALAGAGPVPALIAGGALALGIAGVALLSLGAGLSAILGAVGGLSGEEIGSKMKAAIGGTLSGFKVLDFKDLLIIPPALPIVAGMGGALAAMGVGLSAFLPTARSWTKEDSETVKDMISSLSEAYATAGSTEGMSSLFGFPVGSNAVERGIESTMEMGQNLENLAGSIKKWKQLGLDQDQVQAIGEKIQNLLNVIPGIFASIGKRERGSGNFVNIGGVSFGLPFTSGDIEMGIESTMEMGQNLNNLADGIMKWQEIELGPQEIADIVDKIQPLLATIPTIFANIGKAEKGSKTGIPLGGIGWSITLPNPFEKGAVTTGIEAAKKFSDFFKNTADAVLKWQDTEEGEIQAAAGKIDQILTLIPKHISKLGEEYGQESGLVQKAGRFFFGGESNFAKGMQIIDALAPGMKSLSTMMEALSGVEDPTSLAGLVGKGMESLLGGIKRGVQGFTEEDIESLESLADPLSEVAESIDAIHTSLKKHLDYVTGLDASKLEAFQVWADSIKKLSEAGAMEVGKTTQASKDLTRIEAAQRAETEAEAAATTGAAAEGATRERVVEQRVEERAPRAAQEPDREEGVSTRELLNMLMNEIKSLTQANNDQQEALDNIHSQLVSGLRIKEEL